MSLERKLITLILPVRYVVLQKKYREFYFWRAPFSFTFVFSLKKDILKIAMTQVSQNLLATSMFSYKIPVIRDLNEVLLL